MLSPLPGKVQSFFFISGIIVITASYCHFRTARYSKFAVPVQGINGKKRLFQFRQIRNPGCAFDDAFFHHFSPFFESITLIYTVQGDI